ncbi:MAG: nuclear transport factor 2 family protein [Bacteroidales bacterium]|nr:nuclear transport factor 2 family protein [Bacteroidales bacterium]MCF8337586.1 nuclear transport factor 2 family protein [Bacteroidales bacterium]
MKNFLTLIVLFISFTVYSQDLNSEQEAVKSTVETAYVEGIHNMGSIEAINNGFHPGFEMLIKEKNYNLSKFPIYTWKKRATQRKENNPDGPQEQTTAKYPMIEVTGDAAIVKVELYKKDKKLFTDYISLYKFKKGWKIVSKIYYKHD